MSKRKVLWVSDSPRISYVGQSVVGRECLNRLQKDYDVQALGWGDAQVQDAVSVPYEVIPALRSDMLNADKMSEYMEKAKPDILIMSHDPWMMQCLSEIKYRFPQTKYLGYITIDGEPAYYGWYPFIKAYDKIISPSVFSKNTIEKRWIDINVDVVPYGVNHDIFRIPKQGKPQLKADITNHYRNSPLDGYIDIAGKFVAIYVGANQDRKNLGLIHETWREFEKGKENQVQLLMFVHSADLKEQVGHYDLSVFAHDTDTLRIINIPQPVEIIGQFMAASDVLFHPSSGEGFGLTVLEAMACGTVPIVLPYAAVTDFCNESNSYQIPYLSYVGGCHAHRAISAVENALEVMNLAFSDHQRRYTLAMNAYNASQRFTWDNCIQGLTKSIEETLAIRRDVFYTTRIN